MNNFRLADVLARAALLFSLTAMISCSRQETVITDNPVGQNPVSAAADTKPEVYEKSIAVLPFTDLSENSDQVYFSDGLSNDLINRLAMMPDLEVAGRESSFYYKGRDEVLSNIGASLNVANILLGSVRKSGNQLRVSAQLVSAKDGFNIWSRSWDRELADVFAIQEEITEAVTTALSVTLGAGRFALPGMTHNIDAYDLTLQAQEIYNQFTPDSVFRAINMMEQAVKLDPTFGRAWLTLGSIYNDSMLILSADQSADFNQLAQRSFDEARKAAPDIPELLLVDAGMERNAGNFVDAERIYQHYFELHGYNNARAMEEYAQLLSRTGQMSKAIDLLQNAKRFEPLAPRFTYQLALVQMINNDVAGALRESDYGLTLSGGQWLFSALAWQVALKQGDLHKAADLIQTFYAQEGDATDATVSRRFMEELADILQLSDFDASAERIVKLINDPGVTPLELGYLARLVAVLGQPEIALDYWFGEMASPGIWDNMYTDMRKLPGFKELVKEKGLLEYWRTSGNWGDYCQPDGQDFVCR